MAQKIGELKRKAMFIGAGLAVVAGAAFWVFKK